MCTKTLKNKAVRRKKEKEKILSVSMAPAMEGEEGDKVVKEVQDDFMVAARFLSQANTQSALPRD